jgi:hypothetical protein
MDMKFKDFRERTSAIFTESVEIKNRGKRMFPGDVEEKLVKMFKFVPKHLVLSAELFNSGNMGISFTTLKGKYLLMYSPSRMGSDDFVRGTIQFGRSDAGSGYKQLFIVRGDDSPNAEFPTMGDLGKLAAAIKTYVK